MSRPSSPAVVTTRSGTDSERRNRIKHGIKKGRAGTRGTDPPKRFLTRQPFFHRLESHEGSRYVRTSTVVSGIIGRQAASENTGQNSRLVLAPNNTAPGRGPRDVVPHAAAHTHQKRRCRTVVLSTVRRANAQQAINSRPDTLLRYHRESNTLVIDAQQRGICHVTVSLGWTGLLGRVDLSGYSGGPLHRSTREPAVRAAG